MSLYLFKLQRVRRYFPIRMASSILIGTEMELHPDAPKFVGHAVMENNCPVRPAEDVLAWEAQYPGWKAVFA
jgi:hypothetical protein